MPAVLAGSNTHILFEVPVKMALISKATAVSHIDQRHPEADQSPGMHNAALYLVGVRWQAKGALKVFRKVLKISGSDDAKLSVGNLLSFLHQIDLDSSRDAIIGLFAQIDADNNGLISLVNRLHSTGFSWDRHGVTTTLIFFYVLRKMSRPNSQTSSLVTDETYVFF